MQEQQGINNKQKTMELFLCLFLTSKRLLKGVFPCLCLLVYLEAAWATNEIAFSFEDVDIQVVLKKVSELTRTTFLFDPEQVKGKITLLAPQKVSPEGALKLLQSVLALHGYTLLKKEEGIWVVPAEEIAQVATTIEVVPLKYAKAAEVAETLSWISPPGVRIVPYYPTNSLIISGNPEAVAELIRILREKAKEDGGR